MPNPLNDQALNDPSNRVRATDWAALYYDERARHRQTLINDSEVIEKLVDQLKTRKGQVNILFFFWFLLFALFFTTLLFVK